MGKRDDYAKWRRGKKGCDKKQIKDFRDHEQKLISALIAHDGKAPVGTLANETGLSRNTIPPLVKEISSQHENEKYLKYPAKTRNKGWGKEQVTLASQSSIVTEKERLETNEIGERLKDIAVRLQDVLKSGDIATRKKRKWVNDPNGNTIAQDGSRGYYEDVDE